MHENRETSKTPAVPTDSRSAGEGSGRTARAYVCEESHSGVLPMNHSNKDTRLSAESGEGRPLIKENAGQSNTYPTQSGDRVSQGLAGVRKAAREHKEMEFTAWLCPVFCVNDQALFLGLRLFLGMGCKGRGHFPFPCVST